jgi:hypothetical protein
MTLSVGAFVGMNLTQQMPPSSDPAYIYLFEQGITGQYGWPLIAMETVDRESIGSEKRLLSAPPPRWDKAAVFVDLIEAISILLAIAFVCEWLIRRREARKT